MNNSSIYKISINFERIDITMRYFLIFIVLLNQFAFSQQKKKVLFIGNSYTYANNLPQLLADLALSKQDTVVFDQSVFGGFTFANHCSTAQTWQKIHSNNWDVVILQAQSQEPSFSPAQVMTATYPYAKQLNDSIKAANACTEVMFYMTWGRKNGDASNCVNYPPVCTYAGMQARLRESYLMFSDSCNATCAPIGVAWKKHVNAFPSVDLYSPDESHPSVQGSYLTACVLYSSIFKKNCSGATFLGGLTSTEASNIQSISGSTVLDSLSVWNIGSTKPKPGFTYSQISSNTFQFNNTSSNATSFNWSFGSTSVNPIYTFTSNPPYQITLKAFNACGSDSVNQAIVPAFLRDHVIDSWCEVVNPCVDHQLQLKLYNTSVQQLEIYDLNGKLIDTVKELNAKHVYPLNENLHGLYILKLIDEEGRYRSYKLLIH